MANFQQVSAEARNESGVQHMEVRAEPRLNFKCNSLPEKEFVHLHFLLLHFTLQYSGHFVCSADLVDM